MRRVCTESVMYEMCAESVMYESGHTSHSPHTWTLMPLFCLICTIYSELNGILDAEETGDSFVYESAECHTLHIHINIFIYIHIYINAYMCIYIYLCIFIYMYIHIYMYMHVYIHICMYV